MSRSARPPAVAVCALAAACSAQALNDTPPIFGDWNMVMPEGWRSTQRGSGNDICEHVAPVIYDDPNVYTPINQPGGEHGGPTYDPGGWMSWYATCYADFQDDAGAPTALLIRNRNCPFPYSANGAQTTPDALATALDTLPKLDYLYMDLEVWSGVEPAMVQLNAAEIVRMVRTHPNPRIAGAFIGNYADVPNRYDQAWIWPGRRDRTNSYTPDDGRWDRHAFYHALFNIAMPVAYPFELFSRHSETSIQGDSATPNDRAAIFWAPLERVSASARALPEGHVLIPWITNYVPSNGNPDTDHAPPPTLEDLIALAQHIRMRGARSYTIWTPNDGATDHPTIDYRLFRDSTMAAWSALDPYFEAAGPVEFLNLETDKAAGVQWSAVRTGRQILMLVSNHLEHDSARVELPLIGGLPARSVEVAAGAHRMLSLQCEPAVRDFNRDETINDADFTAYVTAYTASLADNPNRLGGFGGDWRDIDGDGSVGIGDLMLVAQAYWDGEFARFADDRRDEQDGDSDSIQPE